MKAVERSSRAPGLREQQTGKAGKSAAGKVGHEEAGQGRTEGFPACEHQPLAGASSSRAKAG